MTKQEKYKAYIALALVSLIWGTTFLASKVGAQHMPGLFVSGVRQFSAGILMVGFFLLKGFSLPSWSDLKKISIQGLLLLCVANGLHTWALEYISSGLSAIISALIPIFVTVFTMILSQCRKITRWMLAGLTIGFAGILIIFYEYLGQMNNNSFLFGVLLALVATMTWAFGTVYTAKKKTSIDLLFNVGLQMLIAGVITLVICYASGKYVNLASSAYASWYALIYLVVFGSVIAYSAYVFAISKLSPTIVSIYAYINPIIAVALGWLLLHEKMNVNMVLGTIVTLGGIYLVNREFKKEKTGKISLDT